MFKHINNNIFRLEEEVYNSDLENRIRAAAETQRGEPESTMLKCQRIIQTAGGSNVLSNALEHVGDLSHRAQAYNAIVNVDEKVNMMLQYWSPKRWSLEKEIEDGTVNNCIYRYLNNTNQYDQFKKIHGDKAYDAWQNTRNIPDVIKMIEHANKEINRALTMYVESHEKYNQPITKLGLLGKHAAIALGKLDYVNLHKILLEMKHWVTKYNSLDENGRWEMYSELI